MFCLIEKINPILKMLKIDHIKKKIMNPNDYDFKELIMAVN